jgi:N-methylhydantoinase B
VAADVVNGYVSIEKAREDYGVVIDPLTLKVDAAETDKVRAGRIDE